MKWLWHLDQYYLSDCSYFRVSHKTSLKVTLDWSKRRNGYQSGGAKEHWKGMSATMVGQEEKFLNSRRSRMAKIVTFWPGWQPFDSFCFETFSFFSFFPYFLFDTKKKWGDHGLLAPPRRCRRPCIQKPAKPLRWTFFPK